MMDADVNCQDCGEPLVDFVSDYDIRERALELAIAASGNGGTPYSVLDFAHKFFAFLTADTVKAEAVAPRADA